MSSLKKRDLVRNPALASHLQPGESIELEDGAEPLVVMRRKKRITPLEQIHAALDGLCKGAPEVDAQAVLHDLRG
jgi:hypothetical protein